MTKLGFFVLWATFLAFIFWVDAELGAMALFLSVTAIAIGLILWGLFGRASTSR